ncbi:MAG: hypothetical protein NZ772_19280 [Cyanobacteria bacterium]|nr:hypothetical protein [Cyanobacteriota bacterium]MDW8203334.1 hypothetical protein [Cyanobacteriota bacterium SKYGB_h_bin112]
MNPSVLRQFWFLVEATHTSILLNLDDDSLAHMLVRQLRAERLLNHQETDTLVDYIHNKLPLIRDLAEQRC